ncbi:alanyl-tRNA editing protein Aarsd1-B-like [Mercenaria mercenaria]|uniref:alanyl-tRNA editing protein Aarsd1-B-like n=1 Tax=Mercenaria mercenaria TaxID=6596 RepID=UPI00234E7D28|nr:alanyl-tRNA editing protein Aarsd1-B-like [Mercenaria mercenaria]
MALACQKDSYLKEFDTKVKSCNAAELKVTQNGKKEVLKGYEVILEDTILFPEGGGQPDDRGMINDVPVLRITRRGAEAVNFVMTEIPVGTEVHLIVDWTRRFDHMQQHSGQHLITAMAENIYGYRTTTWNLGDRISFIELDTPKMTVEEMTKLEQLLNEKIREGVKVYPTLFHDKADPELEKARCRGLPDDHEGAVRVLTIDGIDSCLCCGTHVSNASDLQMIKLLSTDKGKRKNSTNLNFVCGGRVVEYLGRAYDVEKSLTGLLKGPLEQHFELAEKAVKGFKNSQKTIQNLLRDVASLEAEKFKSQPNRPSYFIYHRKEGDLDFLNALLKELGEDTKDVLCLLTAGEDKGPGFVMMSGLETVVKDLGPKVMEIFEGKGGYSKGRFQGKANKIQNRTKAAKLVEEYQQGDNNIQQQTNES